MVFLTGGVGYPRHFSQCSARYQQRKSDRGARFTEAMKQRIAIAALLLLLLAVVGVSGAVLAFQDTSPGAAVFLVLIALALVWSWLRLDIGVLLQLVDELRVVWPIAAFGSVNLMIGSDEGTLRFAEIGAQVIVVLLLALAIETRFFRISASDDRMASAGTVLTMVVLTVGEFYALKSIVNNTPENAGVVGGAVAAGFVAVAVTALVGAGKSSSKD
jgi:hypothetical protein